MHKFVRTYFLPIPTLQTPTQKLQAAQYLNSTSKITDTGFSYGNLTINYTAGKSITLLPGFEVKAYQIENLTTRNTVFKSEITGCSN